MAAVVCQSFTAQDQSWQGPAISQHTETRTLKTFVPIHVPEQRHSPCIANCVVFLQPARLLPAETNGIKMLTFSASYWTFRSLLQFISRRWSKPIAGTSSKNLHLSPWLFGVPPPSVARRPRRQRLCVACRSPSPRPKPWPRHRWNSWRKSLQQRWSVEL